VVSLRLEFELWNSHHFPVHETSRSGSRPPAHHSHDLIVSTLPQFLRRRRFSPLNFCPLAQARFRPSLAHPSLPFSTSFSTFHSTRLMSSPAATSTEAKQSSANFLDLVGDTKAVLAEFVIDAIQKTFNKGLFFLLYLSNNVYCFKTSLQTFRPSSATFAHLETMPTANFQSVCSLSSSLSALNLKKFYFVLFFFILS
jgi:hypothetical protein